MQKTVLAYAAGIIDGEGTIRIQKGKGTRRVTPNYQLYVRVGMTHRPTIEKMQEVFGGTIMLRKGRKAQHKNCFELVCSDIKAYSLLSQLRPYLITKAAQADLGIRFRDETKQVLGAQTCSDELIQAREWFFQEMKKLNKRGQ